LGQFKKSVNCSQKNTRISRCCVLWGELLYVTSHQRSNTNTNI